MGSTIPGRETDARGQIETDKGGPAEEARLAATAYFVWPLAVYERVAPRTETSTWYRFHVHQALWFGNIAAAIGLVALFWPLLLSFVVTSVTATIWFYAIAMLADVTLLVLWVVLASRYSRRAGRGELFDVPWVAKLTGSTSGKR